MWIKTKENKVYETKKIVFEKDHITFIVLKGEQHIKKTVRYEELDFTSQLPPNIYED